MRIAQRPGPEPPTRGINRAAEMSASTADGSGDWLDGMVMFRTSNK
jgi:hypothetical protein